MYDDYDDYDADRQDDELVRRIYGNRANLAAIEAWHDEEADRYLAERGDE